MTPAKLAKVCPFKPSHFTRGVASYTCKSVCPFMLLRYDVVAKISPNDFDTLEQYTDDVPPLPSIVQDIKDIIRQEYVDYKTDLQPARNLIVAPSQPLFNGGNYPQFVVDNGMSEIFAAVSQKFNELLGTETTYELVVESGYRNPQRNKDVGSIYVNSFHVKGQALDILIPVGGVPGKSIPDLWCLIEQAGVESGYVALPEDGPKPLSSCRHEDVDHIHIHKLGN